MKTLFNVAFQYHEQIMQLFFALGLCAGAFDTMMKMGMN